ncbi:MAG: NAD(P)-dependent oxidoreductase [Pseudolabrys sp.]|nr:NAD(P)-dependent oxidoreductase [Pseudolabrys sp.]
MKSYFENPVVVTGGSGFIGNHLIDALERKGAAVVNLDKREPTVSDKRRGWQRCDLMDRESLVRKITEIRPRIVYNLAAHASLQGTVDDMKVNFDGVENLIVACRQLASQPFIVHASTQLVAGPAIGEFEPLDYKPFSAYGESKVKSEQVLRSSDARWTIVRPSNIWGPYHPSFARSIWKYIARRVYMHPTGADVIRSYGYVENVVHQLVRIAELDDTEVRGKTFYVGDAPISSAIWLDTFSYALTNRPVRRVPLWLLKAAAFGGELSARIGGPSPINLGRLKRMTSDFPVPMEGALKVLGPGPISLEDGVKETVKWLKGTEYVRANTVAV